MKSLLIIIPAHNEEEIIYTNVRKTISFLKKQTIPMKWKIVVAENGSTDNTISELKKIRSKYFSYISLPVRSRTKAVMQTWLKLNADYYMFMDADLATDIKHIPELVRYSLNGFDIVAGSRRLPKSKLNRTPFRKFMSWSFNFIMNTIFWTKIKDFQCGFKIINREIRDKILPQMKYSDEGFLDTELIVVSLIKGYKVKEIPVKWVNERPSRFKIFKQVSMNLINAVRIKRDIILRKYH